MTPASLTLTFLLVVSCLFLPKRYLLWSFILAACLVPMNQRTYIGSLDFTVLRILVLAGVLRIVLRGEAEAIRWNGFDKLVLAWNVSNAIIYTIQWGTLNAFINRCGFMYDSLGMYWLFRHFFRSFEDITEAIKIFAICAIISAPLVAAEKFRQSSPFSVFGPTGARFHRGRFRCAGAFPHYIIMGCFWASMLPLFYSTLKAKFNPRVSKIGIGAAGLMIYFSASSTPLLTVGAIIAFWLCYRYRQKGWIIFTSICLVLGILHFFIMEKPVWHLMARANIFGGSTGWFRYFLFNEFINHTSEWFFFGVKSTAHWGRGLFDLTNQYVLEGVRGGILTLLIFIVMLYNAVKISGKASLILAEQPIHWIAWGLCISIIGHIVTFWGVSYFGGQILMLFYMQLAMVGFFKECNENSLLPIK